MTVALTIGWRMADGGSQVAGAAPTLERPSGVNVDGQRFGHAVDRTPVYHLKIRFQDR
jgi:hypothetical protein